MTLLTAFAAITACRFADVRRPALRQEDSGAGTLLLGGPESAIVRAMTNAPSALPHDVDALHALILAAREAHAALLAERNQIAAERDQLAVRTEKLEYIVAEMRRAMYRPPLRAHRRRPAGARIGSAGDRARQDRGASREG